VNSDRIDVHLPPLICDPIIAEDPKITPTTVFLSISLSLSHVQELQKNFLSDHIL
jgi:hypothetical protein